MKSLPSLRSPLSALRSLFAVALLCDLCASSLSAADLSITPGSVIASKQAKVVTRVAGATITAGQAVYLDTTTKTEKLADADGATPLYKVEGIALNGASTGQRIFVCTEDPGLTLGATLVIGDTIWLSATAGGITKTAAEGVATGSFVAVLGVATSTTKVNFKIIRADAVKP